MTERHTSGRAIARLKPRRRRYTRRMARNIYLRVHPSVAKVWVFRQQLDGRTFNFVIGNWPALNFRKAQVQAEHLRRVIETGGDVAEVLDQARQARDRLETLARFAGRWLAEVSAKVRKDTRPVERMLARDIFPWLGSRPIAHVGVEEVRGLVFRKRDAGHAAAAAAVRHLLKRIFDYAIVCELRETNPAAAIPMKFVARRRTRARVLSRGELGAFYRGLPKLPEQAARALELLLLTLARKSELRLARWRDVDLASGQWEIPAENSKTGQPHLVYLSQAALVHMRRQAAMHVYLHGRPPEYTTNSVGIRLPPEEFVFAHQSSTTQPQSPAWLNKAMTRVHWGIPRFTVHDLRRTAATHLAELGYDADVIEKALNHTIKGVRGVYNRAQYADQRRKMLEEWAQWLEKLRAE